MDINLNKVEIIVVLDEVVEAVAFDKNADEIKEVYNKIVKQANMDGYEMLGQKQWQVASYKWQVTSDKLQVKEKIQLGLNFREYILSYKWQVQV